MPLLPRQTEEKSRPQVAHQLNLGPFSLQGENVVLVEQGRGSQDIVVPGVIAGVFIGCHIQEDFHHTLLPRQILRLGGDPVKGVAQGDGPGKLLKGFFCLALKIEVVRRQVLELEGGASILPAYRYSAVGEVYHLVVNAVVCQDAFSVHGTAFYYAALQQVAVVIQRGVIRLVIGGVHAVADGRRRSGGHTQRYSQSRRQRQSGKPFPHSLPFHSKPSK